MKELTLEDIHKESLKLLKEFDSFCSKHDIKYSLAYGTLLGAVRHKGFIPWDDDVDVFMTRDNYDKFSRLYKSEDYFFVNRERYPNCCILFGRLVNNTTFSRLTNPWQSGKDIKSGLWIDVFPLDNAPNDKDEYVTVLGLLKHLYEFGLKVRKVHAFIQPDTPLLMRLKQLYYKKVHPNLLHNNSPQKCLDYHQKVIDFVNDSNHNSNYVSQMCVLDDANGYFYKNDLTNYVRLQFEDTEFMVFEAYDSILKQLYGDYMELPAKDKIDEVYKRSGMKFYWK